MGGIPASLYLWDICHLYCSLSPADLATRLQWFSYQLNDTISPIGIAEHCSFIQLWWYDLATRLGRGAQLLRRKAVLVLFCLTGRLYLTADGDGSGDELLLVLVNCCGWTLLWNTAVDDIAVDDTAAAAATGELLVSCCWCCCL